MRYRALSDDGDYTFGQSQLNFLINSPAMVGQSVKTRLLLMRGEWFLDKTEGTPYAEAILGTGKTAFYDLAIQERILRTPGVTGIKSYSSNLNPSTRKLAVTAVITTIYGETEVAGAF